MRQFGLIGKKLSHSFSKKYFTEKFAREHIADAAFELYELPQAQDFLALVARLPQLRGVTVTIPYKLEVMPLLHHIAATARRIGAVNVIKIGPGGRLSGHNSDYVGFRQSLERFLGGVRPRALVLGTGGASRAVGTALEDLGLPHTYVSREAGQRPGCLTYQGLKQQPLANYPLIINTTPLGTYPNVAECPDLAYEQLGPGHFLYDLVYNPEQTELMRRGAAQGAQVKNGLEMLYLQAEEAWRIWNEAD
ncbi:MAG: shikimate dehydrogenase [Bernardetiaceae bacterium]|jgi:shikimate dehydrogenase|nr:shikimate dehydrogenase [Bernardetiaceae bacterium]